jgi:transcriptional antiterminator
MAGKPKRMSQIKQFIRLHQQGLGKKTIARQLGMSKNTVKAYLQKIESGELAAESLLSNQSDGYGLTVLRNDKPTEFILTDFESIKASLVEGDDYPAKMLEEKGKLVRSTLQKLYNEGWKLEGTNGGDSYQTYIMFK